MHYRNGREAKNGDKIVSLAGYGSGPVNINAIGILYDAVPGSDFCNGSIAPIIGGPVVGACLCDCLHLDDVVQLIVDARWHMRQRQPVSTPAERVPESPEVLSAPVTSGD